METYVQEIWFCDNNHADQIAVVSSDTQTCDVCNRLLTRIGFVETVVPTDNG